MKSIRDTCIEFFQSEDIKRDVKAIIKPIVGIIYNDIYPYLLFLCIYHVLLLLLVLVNLILFLRGQRLDMHIVENKNVWIIYSYRYDETWIW